VYGPSKDHGRFNVKRHNYDDRIVRCDEEIKMSVIVLIVFIAVMLAVHEGMLHRFGSPYR
jgi:hypothetical protein